MFEALQAFRAVYPDMTVTQAAALLFVVSEQRPVSMSRLKQVLGVAASTATRVVLTLSSARRGVGRVKGPDLVEQTEDPDDRRWRLTRGVSRGFQVARAALGAVRKAG